MRDIHILVALLCFTLCPCVVLADGVYIPKVAADKDTADLSEPVQRAIIFDDGDQERLILQVSFAGSVSEFCWLVPTPSKPDIGEAEQNSQYSNTTELFRWLHLSTAPRIRYWYDADDSLRLHAKGGSDHPHASDVDVVERKVVGHYDVAVLRAKRADDLLNWLRKHGYQAKQELKPVLQDYLNRGWVFTAVRIDTASYNKVREGMLKPLRLRFGTKDLVYPLKISSLNRGQTKIVLYVVANHFVSARGFRTTCAVNIKTPERSRSLSTVRQHDRDDYFTYPRIKRQRPATDVAEQSNQPSARILPPFQDYNYSITKLTAELGPKQMQQDVLLVPAESLKPFEPKPVPPPLICNVGAVVMLGAGRFFSSFVPYLLSLLCFTAYGLKIRHKKDTGMWLIAALILLLGAIPLGMLLLFQDLGYGLVGLAVVVGIPVLVIRHLFKRKLKKVGLK